jgi:type II secretory pathway component PulF
MFISKIKIFLGKEIPNIVFGLRKEKIQFIENLTMLLSSGMDVLTSLSSIERETSSRKMKRIIKRIGDNINNGSSIWESFQKTGIFSDRVVSLLRIGEKTGNLVENLKTISLQTGKERIFVSKIRSAMMYPVLVITIAFILAISVSWFILPKLAITFSQLNIEMPFITRILIYVGNFLNLYGQIFIPFIILLIFTTIYLIFISKKTKFVGQAILFRFPVIKNLIKEIQIARFGYLLGTLLRSGLPIMESIDSLYRAEDFYNYKKLYFYLKGSIEEGNSFKKSFDNYSKIKILIPSSVRQLIIMGEQSGQLSKSLLRIGETYEIKIDITTKNLTTILEPALLIFVWFGVAIIAVAIILPIYTLIGRI